MSHRIRLVAGTVVAALAVAGLTDLGATPSAAAAGPCSYGGYQGDATVTLDGAATVGAPVTATFNAGRDWTAGVGASDLTYTWSGTGYGAPVRGHSFTARHDLVGADVHLTVRARNAAGAVSFTAVCDLPRVRWGSLTQPAPPQVTGDLALGGTLHATSGSGAADGAEYHYEWFAGDETSAFAIGDSVDLGRRQVGKRITVKAMVTSLGRRDSAWSSPTVTEPVVAGTLAAPVAPTIDGDAVMAGMLTATQVAGGDVPEDASYEFRWLSDGTPFATGRHATLAAAQVGTTITAQSRVSATGYAVSDWSAASAPTATVAQGVLAKPASVTVTGTPKVGELLTAVVDGSWTPGTQVTFTWRADGVPFSTSAGSVRLLPAQLGAHVTLEISGTLAGYGGGTVESAPTETVTAGSLLATPRQPTIAGTPVVGQVLTATVAAADPSWPDGTTYSYRWLADGAQFATGPQVALGAAQVGRVITVQVQATASGFAASAWSPASAGTAAVAGGQVTAPSSVRISGTAQVGNRLTATTTGSWPAGVAVTYTWKADGRTFGTGAGSVLLAAGQLGKRITVEVTGTLAGYDPATVTSAPTGKVSAGRLTGATPKIAGAAKVGRTLTVRTGSWAKGTSLTIRWYAGGKVVRGETGKHLRLTRGMRHQRITAVVTGRLAGYATVSKKSKATSRVR